jgi:hypothetical protein
MDRSVRGEIERGSSKGEIFPEISTARPTLATRHMNESSKEGKLKDAWLHAWLPARLRLACASLVQSRKRYPQCISMDLGLTWHATSSKASEPAVATQEEEEEEDRKQASNSKARRRKKNGYIYMYGMGERA